MGADWLAEHMNDKGLAQLLRIIAYVFLMMPVISLLRGYFQGTGYMTPTALSQVGEQFIRVITILITAIVLVRYSQSLYTIGSGAAFGSITGGIASCIILLYFRLGPKCRHPIPGFIDFRENRKVFKILLFQGFSVVSALCR